MEFLSAKSFHTKHQIETEKHLETLRRNMLTKSQLKSKIPKPVPYVRVKREPRSRSCSSSFFNGSASSFGTPHSRIPTPRAKQFLKSCKSVLFQARSFPSSSSGKSQYSDIKAKIDNSTPLSLLLKMQGINSKDSPKQYNNLMESRRMKNSPVEEPPGDHQIHISGFVDRDQLGESKHSLIVHSESDTRQFPLNLHMPEGDFCTLKQNHCVDLLDVPRSYLLKDCTPEFLLSLKKQLEEVSDMWLQLIRDLIVAKLTIGKGATPRIKLQDQALGWRDVISNFLQNLPTQGDELHRKFCKIEEEQVNILRVVIQNVLMLVKDHKELKEKYLHFNENYEKNQARLKEELAILGQENKELDMKYTSAVGRCELEKSKTEEMEENQIEILKKIFELRKVVKYVGGKCSELEKRDKKVEANLLKLELYLESLEKQSKKYEDLSKKLEESEKLIIKLKREIKESENCKLSLEQKEKENQVHITELKIALENSLQKRTELEKEDIDKDKKIKELDMEIKLIKSKISLRNNESLAEDENKLELMKNLVSGAEKRSSQIQELRKKINRFEHMVRDKSKNEEKLLSHISKLTKKCQNKCTSLKNQIKELQMTEKSLQNQVSELEKILGQKTLELDQRDRLIKELKELIRLKNESEASMWQSRKRNSAAKLISNEESTTCHKKMIEMLNLLERKQMEIIKLERRIWGLQKSHNEENKTGREEKQAETTGNGAVN